MQLVQELKGTLIGCPGSYGRAGMTQGARARDPSLCERSGRVGSRRLVTCGVYVEDA